MHNRLIAASTSLPASDPMQQGINSSWLASNDRPPLAPTSSHRILDDSKSCTYPGAYMNPAVSAPSSSGAFQAQQLHQAQQNSSSAPPRNLAETRSAPPTAALDYLTGFGLGSATEDLHRLRQQTDDSLTANQTRFDDRLADYMARSRPSSGFGNHSPGGAYDSSITWPGSLSSQAHQQHRSQFSPQLQHSLSMSSNSHPGRLALGESMPSNAFSMSRTRPQPMVQNAFTQPGLQLGSRSRLPSPFGFPPTPNEGLLQDQPAFNLSVPSQHKPIAQPARAPASHALAHQQPLNSSRMSLPFAMLSRGEHIGASGSLLGETAAMDVCQRSSPSAAVQASPGAKRRSSAMSLSEQVSQGFALQPQGRTAGRPWRRLPSRASAPSPFATTKFDSSSGQDLDLPPFRGHFQAQPPQLQRQPSHEPLHPNGLSTTEVDDDMPDASPWFSQPDAMREAALALNVQLAQIDKQVLERIVPLCGHATGTAPEQSDSHIIVQQVCTLCVLACVMPGTVLHVLLTDDCIWGCPA